MERKKFLEISEERMKSVEEQLKKEEAMEVVHTQTGCF